VARELTPDANAASTWIVAGAAIRKKMRTERAVCSAPGSAKHVLDLTVPVRPDQPGRVLPGQALDVGAGELGAVVVSEVLVGHGQAKDSGRNREMLAHI
jgi:hypothetical protein